MALLTFEVASPQIDAAAGNLRQRRGSRAGHPHPARSGRSRLSRACRCRCSQTMKFQYTGWMRAQKIVPGSILKAGTNDVIVLAGSRNFRIGDQRETQIQLKYLWDKSDYLLRTVEVTFGYFVMRKNQSAFTLLEIMLVVTIIALLLGDRDLQATRATSSTRAHNRVAAGHPEHLDSAQALRKHEWILPDHRAGIAGSGDPAFIAIRSRSAGISYSRKCRRIPGRRLTFTSARAAKIPTGYDLYSAGPDRKPDTPDDDWGNQ